MNQWELRQMRQRLQARQAAHYQTGATWQDAAGAVALGLLVLFVLFI